jgi:hypothetical protein
MTATSSIEKEHPEKTGIAAKRVCQNQPIAGANHMTTTESINSLGHVCQILQRPYGAVRKAAEVLKISPVVTINGISHFSDHQVETLRRHFVAKDEGRNG